MVMVHKQQVAELRLNKWLQRVEWYMVPFVQIHPKKKIPKPKVLIILPRYISTDTSTITTTIHYYFKC